MSNAEIIYCGSHSPHIGETLAANFLYHKLPNGKILVNYYLPVDLGHDMREIDIVVINHNGNCFGSTPIRVTARSQMPRTSHQCGNASYSLSCSSHQ